MSHQLPITESSAIDLSLADGLLSAGCIKFGEFTLKSGLKSPIYIDLRRIITYPKLLEQIGAAYLPILEKLKFDRLAGLPYAAIPNRNRSFPARQLPHDLSAQGSQNLWHKSRDRR